MIDPVEILGHRAEIQRQSEPGEHEPVLRRRRREDRFGSRDCLEHCAGGSHFTTVEKVVSSSQQSVVANEDEMETKKQTRISD